MSAFHFWMHPEARNIPGVLFMLAVVLTPSGWAVAANMRDDREKRRAAVVADPADTTR